MVDKKQVMFDIERCICHVPDGCRDCSKYRGIDGLRCMEELMADVYNLLKEQEKEIKALCLLIEWAKECGFGFDNFPDEYEQYKDEIKEGLGIQNPSDWFCADGVAKDKVQEY